MRDTFAGLREALADRYLVDRELGRGGMARVFLAKERASERLVAIKVLRLELVAVLGATRFKREIQILRRLNHPGIVPILDAQEAGALLYLVMPFIPGENLRARLERERQLLPGAVLDIVRDVAAAIDHAHCEGIIHRDIKPANILLPGDRALVCDFGVAHALDQAALEPISSSGLVLGTPAYMSPEQAMGRGRVDERCDIYALGCVIYEMLTGEQPFTGPTSQAVIARQLNAEPRSIRTVRPDVPKGMERAVLAALAKDPRKRPASCSQLVHMLIQSE